MTFIIMVLLILGTAALVFWNILMFSSNEENEKEVAYHAYCTTKAKMVLLYEKLNKDKETLENLEGFAYMLQKLFHDPKSSEKKIDELQKTLNKLDAGNFNGINFFVLPGYSFLKLFNITGDKKYFSNIMSLYSDLNGREYAVHDTRYLISCMASCAVGGVGITAILGVLFIGSGVESMGWKLCVGGPIVSIGLAFALYMDVKEKVKARKNEIMVDLPQVVSEIALLTSSGMEIFRAWDEVAKDRKGVLYREMRQTAAEIANGFNPSVAFESFIRRCGTKDTTRLGTSILQNLTRGNAELSNFLTDLSHNVWDERKHNARRLGEQAQSKLMLPMVLIFIGIIILIAVPMALGFGDMGF